MNSPREVCGKLFSALKKRISVCCLANVPLAAAATFRRFRHSRDLSVLSVINYCLYRLVVSRHKKIKKKWKKRRSKQNKTKHMMALPGKCTISDTTTLMEIIAPHSNCTALKNTNGSMRCGTIMLPPCVDSLSAVTLGHFVLHQLWRNEFFFWFFFLITLYNHTELKRATMSLRLSTQHNRP